MKAVVALTLLLCSSALADISACRDAVSSGNGSALKECTPLAKAGNPDAQFKLGYMYYIGQGVAQDYVQAHMWYNLAGAAGTPIGAVENRDKVAAKMTPAQIAEAQRLARDWKPTTAK